MLHVKLKKPEKKYKVMPILTKKTSIVKQKSLKIQSNIFENASELRI